MLISFIFGFFAFGCTGTGRTLLSAVASKILKFNIPSFSIAFVAGFALHPLNKSII